MSGLCVKKKVLQGKLLFILAVSPKRQVYSILVWSSCVLTLMLFKTKKLL